jgi:hypothetical protein
LSDPFEGHFFCQPPNIWPIDKNHTQQFFAGQSLLNGTFCAAQQPIGEARFSCQIYFVFVDFVI